MNPKRKAKKRTKQLNGQVLELPSKLDPSGKFTNFEDWNGNSLTPLMRDILSAARKPNTKPNTKPTTKPTKYRAIGWVNQYNHRVSNIFNTRKEAKSLADTDVVCGYIRTVRVYVREEQ